MAEILFEKKESVSIGTLKQRLPTSCFEAVMKSLAPEERDYELDETIYDRYFNAEPTKPLSDEEQKELFENLGNQWIKNHYSSEVLRSFLDTRPEKKKRNNE